MVLDKINAPNDIKSLTAEELDLLSEEIRDFLVQHVAKTGGHLASNLGVVELTIALHLVFSLPQDKIIFDVGHQSYVHKILTGRKEQFEHLRQFEGMSGFPKRLESDCDAFDTGHSSTSISAGLGMAYGRDLSKEDYSVVCVIGDGSMTGGMAFEAMNNASRMKTNFIIVLNDNNMSINKNVGGISSYLNSIRTTERYQDLKEDISTGLEKIPGGGRVRRTIKKTKSSIKQLVLPGMFFENMGIKYLGPIDGHDRGKVVRALEEAKRVKGPVLVHVNTVKGKGYEPAEKDPLRFHGIGPFEPESGEDLAGKKSESYTSVFSKALCVIARSNPKVIALTAAMPDGTGLMRFQREFPERFIDAGIAEQHCVTFAAGLATTGYVPVFAVYSSFLQRGYDQIIHDVAIQNLHVVFAIDRAGIVGADGETHQGVFDLAYCSMIPNMTVLAPKNRWELIDMLQFAIDHNGPVALRYPRGGASESFKEYRRPVILGKAEYLYREEEVALLAIGSMVETADEVRHQLKAAGISCSLVNLRFAKPLDEEILREVAREHRLLVTMEEGIISGGVGEQIAHFYALEEMDVNMINIGIGDVFVPHGDPKVLLEENGMDATGIATRILGDILGRRSNE